MNNTQLSLCKHCDHFVDVNIVDPTDKVFDPLNPPPADVDSHDWLAKYIHWEDGEQEFDHDAEPGETHTDEEWGVLRPDLFIEHPDGNVGPNSRFHSRRGKIDA
jgi:hypothetical protein